MNPRPFAKWLPFKFLNSNHGGGESFIVPDHFLAREGLDTIFYPVLSGKVYKLWQVHNVFLFLLELTEFSCLYGKS